MTWYALGALTAVGVGGIAATMHLSGIAPVGLLSIGVGGALGAVLVGLAKWTRVNCRKRLLIGAAMLALLAVLAEHAWIYRDFRRQWHEARAKSPHIAMFRRETPWSPAEYFRHEATTQQVTLWCADAALIATAAVSTVAIGRNWLR
jgi:hypothetical protein